MVQSGVTPILDDFDLYITVGIGPWIVVRARGFECHDEKLLEMRQQVRDPLTGKWNVEKTTSKPIGVFHDVRVTLENFVDEVMYGDLDGYADFWTAGQEDPLQKALLRSIIRYYKKEKVGILSVSGLPAEVKC